MEMRVVKTPQSQMIPLEKKETVHPPWCSWGRWSASLNETHFKYFRDPFPQTLQLNDKGWCASCQEEGICYVLYVRENRLTIACTTRPYAGRIVELNEAQSASVSPPLQPRAYEAIMPTYLVLSMEYCSNSRSYGCALRRVCQPC